VIARIPIVFTIFSCARVKKLLPPLGGDWLSHAEGVTLACLWHGLPAVAGTARRAGLSAAGKSLSGKSLWKKVEEVDSAEGSDRHHGVPSTPPTAGLGMTRQPACVPDAHAIGIDAVRVPSCGGVPPTACRQGSPD